MPITFPQLQTLMRNEGYSFFIAPDQPILQLRIGGANGVHTIFISIQDEGSFLQFRTTDYLRCPPSHPHAPALWQTLCTINAEKRFLKFTWDASDGEVVCYADTWVMDGQVTQTQFHRMLGNFFPGLDSSLPRIKLALETGKDPGRQDRPPGPTPVPAAKDQPPGTPPGADKPEIKEI